MRENEPQAFEYCNYLIESNVDESFPIRWAAIRASLMYFARIDGKCVRTSKTTFNITTALDIAR